MADRGQFCACLLRLYHHLFRNSGGVSRKTPGNKGGYLENGYDFERNGSGTIRGNSESGGTARGVNCLILTKKCLNFWIIREVNSQKKESKEPGTRPLLCAGGAWRGHFAQGSVVEIRLF